MKTKIAHYGELGAMGVAVPTAAATIATPYLPDSLATVTYVAAWLGVAVGLGALTISALWHRGLCEACITAVPLNAPQLGDRYRRQFAAIHALTRTRTRVTVGALVAATVMKLTILAWLPALAVCAAAIFWGAIALLRHQRLQPWCPYCGGGGSAHDPTVTAPPTPTVGV